MEKREEGSRELVIDWKHILKSLLKMSWLIAIVGIVFGLLAMFYTTAFVAPKYSSSILLYVNNKSVETPNDPSISASDLSASQSLIDTYIAIMNNRTTMEQVAEVSGLDYTYGQLMGMVSAGKIEGTEVFQVTVTTEDPEEAALIANSISKVLPGRIESIFDGSSMRIVDSAIVNPNPVSPNVTRNTILSFLVGCIIVVAVVALLAIIDDTIRDEDYIAQNYDLPLLAIIPDFASETKPGYKSYKKHGYSYRSYYGTPNEENKEVK